MNSPSILHVHLLGGPCDGVSVQDHENATHLNVNYGIVPQEDGSHKVTMQVAPGMERSHARYVASPVWSAYLKKLTAVFISFSGQPPREKAAA